MTAVSLYPGLQHCIERRLDNPKGSVPVRKATLRLWVSEHGGVCLKDEQLAIRQSREIDAGIIKTKALANGRKRRHGCGAQGGLRTLKELAFLIEPRRIMFHTRGPMMHHPVAADGEVVRIRPPVDEDHAVFPIPTVVGDRVRQIA